MTVVSWLFLYLPPVPFSGCCRVAAEQLSDQVEEKHIWVQTCVFASKQNSWLSFSLGSVSRDRLWSENLIGEGCPLPPPAVNKQLLI